MGSKKVKAIVVDLDRIPPFVGPQEGQRGDQGLRQDAAGRLDGPNFYAKIGTMGMADLQNTLGGLPVRNFSGRPAGQRGQGREVQDGRRATSASSTSRAAASTRTPACPAA
jgi:aldehyde:ferredoxin oxidoreductase